MTHFASWVSPDVMRTLGWALVHFVWQGVALAALAAVVMAICRKTQLRYLAGVVTLFLMLAAPAVTFAVLWHGRSAPTAAFFPSISPQLFSRAANTLPQYALPFSRGTQAQELRADVLLWFVQIWFAGVVILSLRTAGGVVLIERMRRRDAKPVSGRLRALCLATQWRLGLRRAIRYCESRMLEAPAAIGWIRPAVLLPVAALTGLSEEQVQAVIAHELAHIRRFDNVVNLFQIVVETLLFYHPAVWWLSRRVRAERENCCDDAAISICGDPAEYARALAHMAESRTAPAMAMAVNHGPLAARVARLLGVANQQSGVRNAGITAGVLLLAGAFVAANAFFEIIDQAFASATPHTYNYAAEPHAAPESLSLLPATNAVEKAKARTFRATRLAVREIRSVAEYANREVRVASLAAPQEPQQQQTPRESRSDESPAGSYVERMKASGLSDLTVDQVIALKVQGLTPEYVRAMHDLGFKPSVDELIGMKVQGITPEYIREMRAAGVNFDTDKLIAMKVQGISPQYVAAMRELGVDPKSDELIGLKVQGVTPEYIKAMKAAGVDVSGDTIIGMKVQGITPEYVQQMHELGIPPKADELIGMKVQGVTPGYIKEMRDLGLDVDGERAIGMRVQGVSPEYVKAMRDLGLKADTHNLIGMRVQGVTPEYVRDMRATGLKASTGELIGMRIQGVTPEYVKAMRATGLPDFKDDPDEYIAAKIQGITPEFVAEAQKHGFKDLDLDKLIALRHSGVF